MGTRAVRFMNEPEAADYLNAKSDALKYNDKERGREHGAGDACRRQLGRARERVHREGVLLGPRSLRAGRLVGGGGPVAADAERARQAGGGRRHGGASIPAAGTPPGAPRRTAPA